MIQLEIFEQQIELELEEMGGNDEAEGNQKKGEKIFTIRDKIFKEIDIEKVVEKREEEKRKEEEKKRSEAAEAARQKSN